MDQLFVEKVSENNREEMLDFLKRYEQFTLFLLGNFAAYGGQIGDSPYSGNYKLLRQGNEIVGVFCLYKNGSLLVHSLVPGFDQILEACQEEKIPIRAVLGEWEYSSALWNYLQAKKWIKQVTFQSKETLHQVDLDRALDSPQPFCRRLTEADYPLWKPLRLDYIRELNYPIAFDDEQMFKLFQSKVEQHTIWGAFDKEQLVATADLNAKAFEIGQIGGVYTASPYRKKGFAKSLITKLMKDAEEFHGLRKLMIFTGESNQPAKNLYRSLGASPVGSFAIYFGNG